LSTNKGILVSYKVIKFIFIATLISL
jgi:hypothetical protein